MRRPTLRRRLPPYAHALRHGSRPGLEENVSDDGTRLEATSKARPTGRDKLCPRPGTSNRRPRAGTPIEPPPYDRTLAETGAQGGFAKAGTSGDATRQPSARIGCGPYTLRCPTEAVTGTRLCPTRGRSLSPTTSPAAGEDRRAALHCVQVPRVARRHGVALPAPRRAMWPVSPRPRAARRRRRRGCCGPRTLPRPGAEDPGHVPRREAGALRRIAQGPKQRLIGL
jgi:hypothetical protein